MDANGNGKRGVPKLRDVFHRQRQDSDVRFIDKYIYHHFLFFFCVKIPLVSVFTALRVEPPREFLSETFFFDSSDDVSHSSRVIFSTTITCNFFFIDIMDFVRMDRSVRILTLSTTTRTITSTRLQNCTATRNNTNYNSMSK